MSEIISLVFLLPGAWFVCGQSSVDEGTVILNNSQKAVFNTDRSDHSISRWRHHTSVWPTPVMDSRRKPIFSSLSSTRRGGSSTWYSELKRHKTNVTSTFGGGGSRRAERCELLWFCFTSFHTLFSITLAMKTLPRHVLVTLNPQSCKGFLKCVTSAVWSRTLLLTKQCFCVHGAFG